MIAERKHLSNQLALVKKAVATRNTVGILKCIRVTCEDGNVTLSATDMEIAATIPVTVSEAPSNFDLVVPFAEFEQLVKAASSAQLWIDETVEPESYVMLADGTLLDTPVTAWIEPEHKLADFPALPVVDEAVQELKCMVSELAVALAVVLPSASKEESRPVLTGVAIDSSGTDLKLVSTDSYRLHLAKTQGVSTGESALRLVPARFLRFVNDYAKKEKHEVVTFRFSERNVEARFDQSAAVLTSRIIDGSFPKYEQLMPASLDYLAGFDSEQLLIGVKQVLAMKEGKAAPAVLLLEGGKWYLESGSGKARIELTKANGGPWPEDGFAIGFNPEFFASAVKVAADETVIIEMNTPLKPIVVSPRRDDRTQALVMPIRLNRPVVAPAATPKPGGTTVAEVEPKSVDEAKAARATGVNSPTNQFLIEANVAMANHYRVVDLKMGSEREEKEKQRTYHNALVAWYLGKRKTQPLAGDLAPAKASVVKARVTRIASKHGLTKPQS